MLLARSFISHPNHVSMHSLNTCTRQLFFALFLHPSVRALAWRLQPWSAREEEGVANGRLPCVVVGARHCG
jgi:hypothetical protein